MGVKQAQYLPGLDMIMRRLLTSTITQFLHTELGHSLWDFTVHKNSKKLQGRHNKVRSAQLLEEQWHSSKDFERHPNQ